MEPIANIVLKIIPACYILISIYLFFFITEINNVDAKILGLIMFFYGLIRIFRKKTES